MIIKEPPIYDISHWKEVPDFNTISPRPFLMITKATEGVSFIDSKFIRFFAGMKQAGYLRGAYHFHRRAYSGVRQAQFFTDLIRPYIDQKTILILDVEEGGEDPASILVWFDYVRQDNPGNEVLLYSTKLILERWSLTAAQKEAFKKIRIWTAGYPYNPDLYSYVPASYIPDPTRFGSVAMWQYSANGNVAGIDGDVDLNWISPAYQQILGGITPPPVEPIMEDKYFKVTTSALNIRSSAENLGTLNDIGDLVSGDIVHAIEVVTAGGVTWHRIDPKVYRLGLWANLSITSPTGKFFAAEKGTSVWMVEVANPTPPTGLPDTLYIATKADMSDKTKYIKA